MRTNGASPDCVTLLRLATSAISPADQTGVLPAKRLQMDERQVFNPTDRERLDGFPDHVSCSIQYPNAWYFRKARLKDQLFRDWVVLLIRPHYLWHHGTKFCPRNAAAGGGEDVAAGLAAFESLYAPAVRGAKGNTYRRLLLHPSWLPTDEQAEVLIPDLVRHDDLLGVAVADEAQGRCEAGRLAYLGIEPPPIYVAPGLLRSLRIEHQPSERWYPRGNGADAGQHMSGLGAMSPPVPSRRARAEGALIALAAGDALGWPQERRPGGGGRPATTRFEDWERRSGGRFFAHREPIRAGEYQRRYAADARGRPLPHTRRVRLVDLPYPTRTAALDAVRAGRWGRNQTSRAMLDKEHPAVEATEYQVRRWVFQGRRAMAWRCESSPTRSIALIIQRRRECSAMC